MEIIKILLGFRDENLTGPGIPRGRVMELRAVALVLLFLALVAAGWLWKKREEREIYFQQKTEHVGRIQH